MYKFHYESEFSKNYEKFNVSEKKQIKKALALLSEDPAHPSLRTKRIKGVNDLYECSANMDIRIIWRYKDDVIVLLKAGRHDILKRY